MGCAPSAKAAHYERHSSFSLSVVNIAGNVVWSSEAVKRDLSVQDVKLLAVKACGLASGNAALLNGDKVLDPGSTLVKAGVTNGAQLTLVKVSEASERCLAFICLNQHEAASEARRLQEEIDTLIEERNEDYPQSGRVGRIVLEYKFEPWPDLWSLQTIMRQYESLIVLLTPNLLTRPWCLIEIVTAHLYKMRLVPVELHRPGHIGCPPGDRFVYPDEDFYRSLRSGDDFLDESGRRLLEDVGYTLEMVEQALREVFQKIAMPFTSSRAATVRRAEEEDILRGCLGISYGTKLTAALAL